VWLFEDELTSTQVQKSRSIKKNDHHIFYNQRYFDANHSGKSANSDCSIVCKCIFKSDDGKAQKSASTFKNEIPSFFIMIMLEHNTTRLTQKFLENFGLKLLKRSLRVLI